jgi:predicted RNase H-like HicB family nuclease
MGMQAIKQGSSQAWFNLQQEQQQKRGEAGTTALPSLMGMFEGGEFGDMTQDQVGMEAELIDDNQQNFNQPIVEVPLPEQGPVPSAVAAPPQEEEMPPIAGGRLPQPSPQPTPLQQAAASATKKYFRLNPRQQQRMDEETTYSMEELQGNFSVAPVAGLGRFIPGAAGVGVPKPITRKEKSITISNQGRQNLRIDGKTIDEATRNARDFAKELADAVSQIESRPETMQMISEAGGINKVAAKDESGIYKLKPISGGDDIEIDKDTYIAIDRIKASRSLGAASGNPIVVGRYDFASEAEAKAANLPPGTEIFINGRRARIKAK